jgi:hypothetical protein
VDVAAVAGQVGAVRRSVAAEEVFGDGMGAVDG